VSRLPFSSFISLILGWYPFLNSFMPLCKSLIFLFLLLVSSSLILSYRYSLFFFPNILLDLCLKFCRLCPLIWPRFCNHFNLACFCWSINFQQLSSNQGLLCFSMWYPRFSLTEVVIFSLILFQALLMFKFSSSFSKATKLFEISSWFCSLTFMSSSFLRSYLFKSNFALLVYLLKFSLLILPLPGSSQYHSQLL
jgi:hypothetical protein